MAGLSTGRWLGFRRLPLQPSFHWGVVDFGQLPRVALFISQSPSGPAL